MMRDSSPHSCFPPNELAGLGRRPIRAQLDRLDGLVARATRAPALPTLLATLAILGAFALSTLAACGDGSESGPQVGAPNADPDASAPPDPTADAAMDTGAGGSPDAGGGRDAGPADGDGDGPSDAGFDAGGDGDADVDPTTWTQLPERLSETGLFADLASRTLADGVMRYAPRFPLFSDGAEKARYLWLPPGTRIDNSDMDAFRFPLGTRAWKDFSRDGVLVETRMLMKVELGWLAVAYLWRPDGSDADAVPQGQPDALGTPHDVPSDTACYQCHEGRPDMLLGVGAIQLAHEGDGLTLAELDRRGLLTEAAPSVIALPGDAVDEAALGGLHVNCGSCHSPGNGEVFSKAPGLDLWLRFDGLGGVQETVSYQSTVGADLGDGTEDFAKRIVPGEPGQSGLLDRIELERGLSKAMPPIGVELVDEAFADTLRTGLVGLR